MSQEESYEDNLIQQQLKTINKPEKIVQKWGQQTYKPSIWSNYNTSSQIDPFADPNKHRFDHYADKQLYHLITTEEFDFQKIAQTLNYIFRDQRMRFTEISCRERWNQLYILRDNFEKVKQKRMEDKRASSVSTFSEPFSLYNLEEMIGKMEKNQKNPQNTDVIQPNNIGKNSGYNIFKNSIRIIDDIEGYKKRESEMLHALQLAQDPSKVVTDKLMHFSPYYERLNEFQVKQQELTEEKMKEIMSLPIQMENLQVQLRVKDMNQSIQSWKPKQKIRQQQFKLNRQQHKYDIQQDWDQYQSD